MTSSTSPHVVLHTLFREQAAKTPDHIAVVGGGSRGASPRTSLTYAELDSLSDSLAARLQSEYGAGIGSLVGIYMPKDVGYVVSYIAALKAGGAYMPIDANYPDDLLQMVMDDAKPCCVCTTKALAEKLPESQKKFIFDDESSIWRKELSDGEKPQDLGVKETDPAYCVYSSGTTGKPKGIVCPHRGAVVSYDYRFGAYPYGEDEREACNVFFVWELLRPLLKGATLYVVPDAVIYDSAILPQYIKENEICRMLFTPSLLEAMLDSPGVADMTGLKLVILCGEVASTQLRQKIRKHLPKTRIHNLYSVSECHDVAGSDLTVDDLQLEPSNRKFCPVGNLLPQVKVNILDPESLEPVPLGVAGEIYVEGPTLAIGYLNRPELTAAKFITRNGKRMYKTGDVGYVVEGGMLEISGRCDSMVKIRGYSIELKAVMAIYELCGDIIHECIVTTAMHNDDRKLVAYVVRKNPSADAGLVKKTIKSKLKSRLPFYMIPTYISVLSTLPVNSTSGKLDAKRLPEIDFANESSDMTVPPATTTERTIASIYATVLDIPTSTVDVTLGFFELGGHSLLTIKLLQLLNAEYPEKEIALQDLFDHQSVRRMADFIVADRAVSDEELDLHQEVSILQKSFLVNPSSMQQVRAFWRNIVNEGSFGNSRPSSDTLQNVLQSQGAVVVPAGGFRVLYAASGCDVASVVHDVCLKIPALKGVKGAIVTTLDDNDVGERGLNAFLMEISRAMGFPMVALPANSSIDSVAQYVSASAKHQ
ncbi:antibiotic synthetase, putative [Perkinsus marinus ATCC 50983]|uniref:Antibiotic synthetase, putative n=1 Tax=Perkinsus marinus (strain ATCC 50983 / TXsc) TaxID=423536 RepID=C5LDC0_PERM5|nr:antibiotic synthetase, putative [Perkinsus marinus ATCC 50983]EER05252.1 antibiotic synthetase, putative [Perkinsus marinus ATCC 50983]|eukprot:XP_002773436.1 antibiotic synthetase, putative [Perkinsus marinus ATCC 50983]